MTQPLIQPLGARQIQLVNNYPPDLQIGDTYSISVSQSLNLPSNNTVTYLSNQKFIVGGERFTTPNGSVYSTHPVSNSLGNYCVHLPSIVFKDPKLPWQIGVSDNQLGVDN